MSKRKIEHWDPTKSDSDDLDWDAASSPKARSQHRSRKSNKNSPRKPPKRRREAYGDSEDDIELDSNEASEEEASFAESSDEAPVELNPRTGRGVRSAAKKPIKYEESEEEDIIPSDSDRDPLQPTPARGKRPARADLSRPSLIVKLKLPKGMDGRRSTRTGSGSRTKREPTPQSGLTRRSSRISHDEVAPLVALTDSGKHEVVTRAATETPEPPVRRPTRGGKGLKKPPSAIMEASQEDSGSQGLDIVSQMEEAAAAAGDKAETQISRTSPTSAAKDEDIRMEYVDDEEEAVVQESQPDIDDEDEGPVSRGSRLLRTRRKASTPPTSQPGEIADEAAELDEDNRRNKRPKKRPSQRADISFEPNLRSRGNRPDYRILRPELLLPIEDDDAPAGNASATPQRNKRGGGTVYRSLFSTFGPFGGAGGPPPVFGGPDGAGALGGAESDSSDDDMVSRPQQGIGGAVGMTPTSAFPKPFAPQAHNNDALQGAGGGPPGLGKVKDKKALADADPLGVDVNVNFDGVGGLDNHINQLKEMVALPLLYPEVFTRFHVTPPRGVLFHGPPGTGKTLLARALASSVSSGGRKVTFYMRKGADALSKWVGEAEKQLRLLFEEARKNQPSIIFFDEIDGLAPVRSSKQEQIHASIVATLLALMDGMDGRGQVIVIGATNRPDSVDPALRRPGRFDREFYFPLPDQAGRRKILDIHTKGWDPPLQPQFKDQLAEITRGYGGADLRALCTEAALNAVQGTYPQIYASDEKLIIDPSTIKVLAKDFMISVNKMIPSSERSASSGATPLKKEVEPLLRQPLIEISNRIDEAIPRKRKATALEEAMYDDRNDEFGFQKETMQRDFEASRIFRPRLLITGKQGMGQQYLGAALLSKFEGLHVQSFDLPTLMKDTTRSTEAAVVQLFEEVKRHKPSVIYIPSVNVWYETLSDATKRTFVGLLRSLHPTDPVLLLGIMEQEAEEDFDQQTWADKQALHKQMVRELFGYSNKNQYDLLRPTQAAREEFFNAVIDFVRKSPKEFPGLEGRKKRKLEALPIAPPPEAPKGPTKAELKAQKKKDHQTLNMLKLHIQPVMDQIKRMYKKFRTPIIDELTIAYLYDEQDPQTLTTDLTDEQKQQQQLFRPFEIDKDEKGVGGLREASTGNFYYNLEIVTIEKRLSNGYYKRPKDFLGDIKRLAKDAKTSGDQDRTLRANEMLANVEVDMAALEIQQSGLVAECEAVYQREQERLTKAHEAERRGDDVADVVPNVPPPDASKTTDENSGPVMLGQQIPGRQLFPITPKPNSDPWSTTNGSHPSEQTNGSTVPSRPQEDSEMFDSEVDMQDPSRRAGNAPQPGHPQGLTRPFSQRSAHTQLAQGSQLDQYQNSASTTNSAQKTSSRSSGPFSAHSSTNGVHGHEHPDFTKLGPALSGSQIPDTQDPSAASQSQLSPSSQHSMAPPPRDARAGSLSAILNAEDDNLTTLHAELVRRSSGLSLEQMEQINASLMDVIWKMRGEYNRSRVCHAVKDAFNTTVQDIELCQKVWKPSQD
ncbi:Bromodomain-containing AAA ATPase protein [Zymoseptoria tritici IPO323]|uniref:Bromodomain-containing AAA ATPase protein n=1 Tax=Zymoseptoria tritici (strain CBS 115943 / IPO323) TaxID=336722 RepID=F9X8S6_ZYMTI|nr:Bromodomain-containing AAA ATPase protein [Zymoseptoria tritici IPO323]EGP87834.1 Bromodomain-containing AAA ATPase protein [Zymoseptoria tritici IPO323]